MVEPNSSQQRYRRKADLMGALIDDEVVLLHVEKGLYYNLKGVGADLWSRLETPHSLGELVDLMCEDYEVAPDVASAEISQFISELLNLDAIAIVVED
jgi:hypothetical protein